MADSKLQRWALIAEIASGLAVVVSLIFVGLQIQQSSLESNLNTRAIEVNAYQELNAQVSAVSFEMMTNPEFADLVDSIYFNEIPAVEPLDRRVRAFFSYTISHSDTAYNQYVNNTISEDQLFTMLSPLRGALLTDAGKLDWEGRSARRNEFHDYVEKQMAEVYPSDTYWQNR